MRSSRLAHTPPRPSHGVSASQGSTAVGTWHSGRHGTPARIAGQASNKSGAARPGGGENTAAMLRRVRPLWYKLAS
jgi:hypothetical protein